MALLPSGRRACPSVVGETCVIGVARKRILLVGRAFLYECIADIKEQVQRGAAVVPFFINPEIKLTEVA